MKREEPRPIGNILKTFLESYGLSDGIKREEIYNAFDAIVGERNLRYIAKREFFNGKIFCSVTSSVVRTTLIHHRERILKEINGSLGKELVKEIIFR
ncbi:MAG: DUF721 domain-containing protein [Bacteroidales bacterium]